MQIIRNKTVKVRKPVVCWGCGRKLPTGTVVEKTTSVDRRSIMTVSWCATCREVLSIIAPDLCDGYCFGELTEYEWWSDVMYETEFWPS